MPEELTPLPCPFCGGSIVEPLFTYYAQCSNCGCEGPYQRGDSSPTMPAEAIAAWNRRAQPEPAALTSEQRARLISSGPNAGRVRKDAQPAAPAILMSAVFVKEGTDDFAPQRLIPSGSAVYLAPPAAPSVAPEPQGLSDDDLRDLADSACQEALSFGVGVDAFLRLAHTVRSRATSPPRAPLTEVEIEEAYRESQGQDLRPQDRRRVIDFARAVIAAAHGIRGQG